MPITTISLVLNLLAAGAVWLSGLQLIAKVIVTVLVVFKFGLFVYSALVTETEHVRGIGLVVCGVLNLCGVVYAAVSEAWTVMVPLALALILLVIWRIASGDFTRKSK